MLIDLHCHTKRIKTGDGVGREVTPELFRKKVIEAGVSIVAITNHNAFDYSQYTVLKELVSDACQVWPGIEIDIKDQSSKWHLIVVVNPDNAIYFKGQVDKLFEHDNLETCTHTLDDILEAFQMCDALYISHFHKSPSISDEDRKKLVSLVGDPSRVFNETQDHKSMGVFANYDYNTLIGSDVKNWEEYEKCTFAEVRLPVESFTQFCLLAKRDASVVDSLINKKTPYSVHASPHRSVTLSLKIYPDVNIIFGAKGTGKTEILTSLYNRLLEQGLRCVKSVASERADEFNELLKNQDMPMDLSIVGRDSCVEQLAFLKSWSDSNPMPFSRYIDWFSTKENNSNKSRMKITNAQEIQFFKPSKYEEHKTDYRSVGGASSSLGDVEVANYIGADDSILLHKLVNKLKDAVFMIRKQDVFEENAVRLTNYSIDKIKTVADRNTDSVSKPSTTGYREFARNRIKLLVSVDRILTNLNPAEKNNQIAIGSLEDKGAIYINSRYRILCEDSKTDEFKKGIRALKEVKEKLSTIQAHIFDADLAPVLDDCVTSLDTYQITTLDHFLGRSKQIVTSDLQEYKPSNGEKGILLLQRVLSKDADAYFLDEPELGMGNTYIDSNIRPMISGLGKQRKIVVVATHNANIAVRTLPYMSIFRTHKNGVYKTYMGNPFNDRLVNIDDCTDVLSWTTESLRSLEGSREAFYERKDIYESGS